jgi:ABC-2 type transport system permease protein
METAARPLAAAPEAGATERGGARLALNLATIRVLWWRDMVRFFRQRTRVVGALAQPLIFWVIIGGGLSGSFAVSGAAGLSYQEYFFPGIIMMVVLFTSIFSTMSVIEDRHAGFLQAVLVAPSSRTAVVLGKTLGGVAVALVQAALFLAMLGLAHYHVAQVSWLLVAAQLLLMSIALTSLGFALAWWIDSQQGYHAIMFVLLIPAWVLSGAMFPVERADRVLVAIMRANPVTYGVEGLRRALYGGALPAGVGVAGSSAVLELAVVAGFAALCLTLAGWTCSRRA